MVWSWSHTQEAYDYARCQLEKMKRSELEIIYAEWRASQDKRSNFTKDFNFNRRQYNRTLAWVKNEENISTEEVIEAIWEWASQQATCDNGGFHAWMCPYGCEPHTVNFVSDKEENN